jgi:hypothetical protein
MAVFSFFGCLTNQHDPTRRDVTWDGRGYIGTCRHCGAPIYRHKHHDWRKRTAEWEAHRSIRRV